MALFQWLRDICAQGRNPRVRIPDGPHTPPVRRRYRFSGSVQGVGFRYEAKLTASQLHLTGWARNESDGSVTVEVQGGAGAIDEFIRVMRAVPRFYIAELQMEELPLSGSETSFRIQ